MSEASTARAVAQFCMHSSKWGVEAVPNGLIRHVASLHHRFSSSGHIPLRGRASGWHRRRPLHGQLLFRSR